MAQPTTLETMSVSPGYAGLGDVFVQRTPPTPLPSPYLIAFNPDVAAIVGIASAEATRPEFVRLAAGCAHFGEVEPYAAVYAGHQFGTYAGQLGDGRAITLGEIATATGDVFEWQVKGAGLTPFSRFGDGRAVLRSTIREYLCSEAMAALGIPTTRALAIAGSAEPVYRESVETAAVLTRIAPSHLRFGTFELFHYRGDFASVKKIADYAIAKFFRAIATIEDDTARYTAFLREIVERTGRLVARWQAVGFAHGVMNTDNMSILGLTLDYGPFGFLDTYDAGFICNHTDAAGRYAFDRQPTIGLWNCHALAAALSSLVPEAVAADALAAYQPAFRETYLELLRAKFGLIDLRDDDVKLFADAFTLLQANAVDHTLFFRALCDLTKIDGAADAAGALFTDADAWQAWARVYRVRLLDDPRSDAERALAMRAANPQYVLRNYLAQNAISAAESGDYAEIERLHTVLRHPFETRAEDARYAEPPSEAARTICVSCSS